MKLLLITFFVLSCSSLPVKLEKVENSKEVYQVAWIKNLDPVYSTGNLPIGNSSPFIFQDIVYMGGLDGKMRAYQLETGRILWEVDEKQPIQAPAAKNGDYIYYGSLNGRLFVRHYLTGELLYATDLGAPIESSAVFTAGRAIVHLRDHTVIALDAQTGKIFWSYQRSITYNSTLQKVSQVLPLENSLIVGFADGYIASLSLEEGIINWEQRISNGVKFVDVDVSPIYFSGKIVAGSAAGEMKFIDEKNGVIIKSVEITQSHTPYIEKNTMLAGTVFGEVARIGHQGNILKKVKISSDGISSIRKWKNLYIVSTMGPKVYFLNFDLELKSQFDLGHDLSSVFGEISIGTDSHAVFYSARNRLYVLR